MINLENITMVSIDGVDPTYPLKALIYSSRMINFKSIKLFSFIEPENIPINIEFIKIKKFSYPDYNIFIIKNLFDFIDTDYALIIQDDGFVLNSDLWNDIFLNYDYIGSPWRDIPHYNGIRVGNGGFSLRSKKFLDISKRFCPAHGFNEDHLVCISHRNIFLRNNIKYAPVEIAMKFSLEFPINECEFDLKKTFGFHGNKNVGTYELKNKLLDNV